jgi:hypothetical protein
LSKSNGSVFWIVQLQYIRGFTVSLLFIEMADGKKDAVSLHEVVLVRTSMGAAFASPRPLCET